MSSFKIGDIITANDVIEGTGITKGCTYVALRFSYDDEIVEIMNDDKDRIGYYVWRFILTDEENE